MYLSIFIDMKRQIKLVNSAVHLSIFNNNTNHLLKLMKDVEAV